MSEFRPFASFVSLLKIGSSRRKIANIQTVLSLRNYLQLLKLISKKISVPSLQVKNNRNVLDFLTSTLKYKAQGSGMENLIWHLKISRRPCSVILFSTSADFLHCWKKNQDHWCANHWRKWGAITQKKSSQKKARSETNRRSSKKHYG